MIDAATYSDLGRILKNARLKRRVEHQVIARDLHIRAAYLEALEEGELDSLPGEPYVRGYYQTYAKFLQLPADQVVEAYMRIGTLPERRMFRIPEIVSREPHPSPQLVVSTFGIAVVILIAWLGLTAPVAPPRQTVAPLPSLNYGNIQARDCLLSPAKLPAWPPCYYNVKPLFLGLVPRQPLKTIMDLK